MRRRTATLCALLVGLPLVGGFVGPRPRAQSVAQTPQSTFRSAVTLVPVDVRVIDAKTGAPVIDLRQEDFSVFEDGVRQEIRHFAVQSFADARGGEARDRPGAAETGYQPVAPTPGPPIAAQTRRVFLIVLGRGRLQNKPANALDAAAQFVRKNLLARDLVAIFAFDRATNFTTDHEQAAQVIDRFKAENDAIEAALARPGLAAVYGSRDLPAEVQARVDRAFQGTSSLPYSPLGGRTPARAQERLNEDTRRRVEDTVDRMVAAGRLAPQEAEAPIAVPTPGLGWEGFDSFVDRNMQTLDDTQNLYAAIAFMQRIEGEKHLVYMTRTGIYLRALEDYDRISAMAADARVALDVMCSGFGGVLQSKAMRGMSEDTGGVSSIAEYGHEAFDRVDLTTRSSYLLGYYPPTTKKRGEDRKIRVTVNRPDVTIMFRHGYRSSDEFTDFDRRGSLTQYRLMAAARYPRDINDISVKMHADVRLVNGQFVVTVDAVIDPTRLRFAVRDGSHVGNFDVAVVAMDATGQMLAGQNSTLEPGFNDEMFARIRKEGLKCTYRMPVPSGTRYVRFIVYDYAADLVGTSGSRVF